MKQNSDYCFSADLIITALLPFFLSAKIIIHLLRYLPNKHSTSKVNFLISNSLYLTQIKEVKINKNETTLQLSK